MASYAPASAADPPSIDRVRLHVILGNEASDCDSIVCSIVLAWYLTALHPPHTGNVFVPLMNLSRAELPLRGDVLWALSRAGLEAPLLWCTDEVDWPALRRRASLSAILVDHNNLSAALEPALAHCVVGVLDHHRDEGLYPLSFERGNRRIQMPTGSCSSLLAEMILQHAPELLSEEALVRAPLSTDPRSVPAPLAVATLLHYTLLLDTSCLSESAGKVTPTDARVAEAYQRILQRLSYVELHRRRNDVSLLSTAQLLAKDTKYGESVTYPHFIASIPGSLASWSARDPLILPNIESVARAKNLRFVVLLTSYTDATDVQPDGKGKFKREITLLVLKDIPASVPGSGSAQAPVGTAPAQGMEQLAAAQAPERLVPPSALQTAPIDPALVQQAPNVREARAPLSPEALLRALSDALLADPERRLDCRLDPELLPASVRAQPHNMLVATFVQQNIKGSRKQVAPIVDLLLSKL